MKLRLPSLITNILGAGIFVALAGGATLLAMSKPSLHLQKPAPVVEVPAPVVEAPVVAPVVTPEPTPVPAAPVVKTATTNSFVHLRASASTSSDILADLQANTTVTLLPISNSLWQQVKYGNLTGYVYKSYLTY